MPRVFPLIALLTLAACEPGETPVAATSGAQDFATYCAVCHGAGGKGDGEMAADLARKPADLTGLSARNNGTFPTTRVMAKIWGYAGGQGGEVMPNFGPLLDSETVLFDSGDGIQTPTPLRLVQLAEYVAGLGE